MPIKLHCVHCGKKIEAPDSAGGKWGKCPVCHSRLYVPMPPSGDELKLAPLDESELEKQRQLMAETYRLTQDILQERNLAEGTYAAAGAAQEISEAELTTYIVRYLRQVYNAELDEAQRTADRILPHRRKAVVILDGYIKSSEPDPELQDIPKHVLSGLIRNLRTRIG